MYVVGFPVYPAILVSTEIHRNIGMLHSLLRMDPAESRAIMDSTKRGNILGTILMMIVIMIMNKCI